MKKTAMLGLLMLALIVVCSMFFAQTIMTITTPKIKIATARKGRFEDKLSLTGEVGFQSTREHTPAGMRGVTVTIDRVLVRAGDWVEAGQPIAEASPPADLATKITDSREKYQSAQSEFLMNETENARIAENTDSDKNNAIRQAENALNTLMDAQEALIAAATAKGLFLQTDTSTWAGTIQANGDAELTALMGTVMDAQALVNTAEAEVVAVFSKSRTKKELFEYIEKRVGFQRAMDKEQKALLALLAQSEQCKTVCAPHAGYVVELNLEEGKTYDATKAAVIISVDCEPIIKCDVSGTGRKLEEGMKAEIQISLGNIQSEVCAVVDSGFEKTDLFIVLNQDAILQLGGLHTLLVSKAKLQATILYKAKQTTSLLSASAVRTEGGGKSYVYTIEQGTGFWGTTLEVRKKIVTVLERGETDISLEEDLSGVRVADKEDRAIADGATVMEYVN